MAAPSSPSRRQRGIDAETAACQFLQQQGMTLLQRNYCCRGGEIDLIMDHGGTTVFVEVRLRNNPRYGSGADSVDWRKQQKLITTAEHYLQRHPARRDTPARFDVVSIRCHSGRLAVEWIDNAFQT